MATETETKPQILAELAALPKANRPKLKLVGRDGNAFAIMGAGQDALRKAGLGHLASAFLKEATSGDYNKVLQTCVAHFNVS